MVCQIKVEAAFIFNGKLSCRGGAATKKVDTERSKKNEEKYQKCLLL